MAQTTFKRIISPLRPLQIIILLLVIATAVVHLQLGLTTGGGAGHPGGSGTPGAGFSGRPGAGFSGTPGAGFSGRSGAGFSGRPPIAGRTGGRPGGSSSILANLPIPLSILFILNFVGYIVLGSALCLRPLQRFQHIIRWLLIALAAVTIAAWFAISGSHPTTLGVVDKIIEFVLILLLLVAEWRSYKKHQAPHEPSAGEEIFSVPVR